MPCQLINSRVLPPSSVSSSHGKWTARPQTWRCQTSPKCLYLSTSQHGITCQKTQIFSQNNPEFTTVTLNLRILLFVCVYSQNVPFWTNIRLVCCILIFKLFLSFIIIPGLFLEGKNPNQLWQSMINSPSSSPSKKLASTSPTCITDF